VAPGVFGPLRNPSACSGRWSSWCKPAARWPPRTPRAVRAL